MVGWYPAGYHAGTMRSLLVLPAMLTACPGPGDSAALEDCTRVDEGIGSIVHVCWEQPEDGTIDLSYRVKDEAWRPTLAVPFETGPHQLPLLGLPFDVEVEWEIHLNGELIARGSLHTDPLPADIPQPRLLVSEPALLDPESPWLLTSIDQPNEIGTPDLTWLIVLDRQGRVVWALDTPRGWITMHPRTSADGEAILMDLNSHLGTFDRGATSQVRRLGLDGGVQQTWDTPGLHHPFTQLPDGSIAWGAWGEGLETLEILDPEGRQRTLWACEGYHDDRDLAGVPCSSNTLSWSEERGAFLFSFYTTHTVVEIDGESGETRAWFGQIPGGWSFDPPESAFDWQHGAYLTQAGTLLATMRAPGDPEQSVAREYALHPDEQRLEQLWSYGLGEGIYAPELGEAVRLPGGNTLINYGSGLRIREVTPEGALAWDLSFDRGSLLGRSEPLEDLYALWPELDDPDQGR